MRKTHFWWSGKKCDWLCGDLIQHIESVHIDDKRVNVLTKLTKTKKWRTKTLKVESDHNIIETKINIPWQKRGNKCIEVFNFKNKKSQEKFFNLTQNTYEIEKIFDTNKSYGAKYINPWQAIQIHENTFKYL